MLEVVGIAGSLRKGSHNRALLNTLAGMAPPAIHVTIYELDPIPMYNADIEAEGPAPSAVAALREAVRQADGLLVSMPEYNYGIPGVLKNTIDWLSRPPRGSCLSGKAAAICGATTGAWGTIRAQAQMREVFRGTNAHVLLRPDILIAKADDKFRDGQLVDEATKDLLKVFLSAFEDLIKVL